MKTLESLKQYQDSSYDCSDIASALVELSGLKDDDFVYDELLDALYWLKAAAQNPYNKDSFRVMYNALLTIAEKDH